MWKAVSAALGLVAVPLLAAAPALAAPQILGLIASAEPVPLECWGRECAAEFTAFCLEQHRRSPTRGRAYYPADPASLTVEGVRGDGSVVALDLGGRLAVTTVRSHTAVRISVPSSVLREAGLAEVRVAVGPLATLVPVPVAGDPKPHSETDIALAAGPLRRAAAASVDRAGVTLAAVRLTSRLINALPPRGRASDRQRAAVWEGAVGTTAGPGRALASEGFERCYRTTRASLMSLRQCLGSWHDSLIGELNTSYWKAIETGS